MKRKGRPRGEAMTGAELRRRRRRLGLTQAEFAARLGTSPNTVYRWEAGLVGVSAPVARLVRIVAETDRKRGGRT